MNNSVESTYLDDRQAPILLVFFVKILFRISWNSPRLVVAQVRAVCQDHPCGENICPLIL